MNANKKTKESSSLNAQSAVQAHLKFARVSAQKARLVADLVRGQDVGEALKRLTFLNKKTGVLLKKLIESAVANADHKKTMDLDRLYVQAVWVGQGPSLKRFRPRAQGRAYGIKKKTSHISVILGER